MLVSNGRGQAARRRIDAIGREIAGIPIDDGMVPEVILGEDNCLLRADSARALEKDSADDCGRGAADQPALPREPTRRVGDRAPSSS